MKAIKLFFDIETLTVNKAAKNPKDYKVREYSVSCVTLGEKNINVFSNLKTMLYHYIQKAKKNDSYQLIAHNGSRYDFHFLEWVLIHEFGMTPLNAFSESSINHEFEIPMKDISKNSDYLFEKRVKARTNLDLEFKLKGVKFTTIDSYQIFRSSIKTLGELLKSLNIDVNGGKLPYSYNEYDKQEDFDDESLRAYCNAVFDSLNHDQLEYVKNDTLIMKTAYINYNKIYPSFNIDSPTLTSNVLKEYEINELAAFQLTLGKLNKDQETERINLSEQVFDNSSSLYEYIHNYYRGGLNFYNDDKIGKIEKDLVHLDINSSYPTVMYFEKFPTFLLCIQRKAFNITCKELLDDKLYFFFEISKKDFEKILKKSKSKFFRKMLIKYFNNFSDSVYLQSPIVQLLLAANLISLKTVLHVKQACIFESRLFAGRSVIETNYEMKTNAKKLGLSKGAVMAYKVILNSVYGATALRPYFSQTKLNNENELISFPDNYKNNERNVVFASTVTSYALRNLLTPLVANNAINYLDSGYLYSDTDSHFITEKLYNKIKSNFKIHPTNLGAWDLEHKHIKKMYVLNHKKYCLLNDNDKIEVFCGGIPKNAFNLDVQYETFVKTQFSNGCKVENVRNTFTNERLISIYNATTEIEQGGKYASSFFENEFNYLSDLLLGDLTRDNKKDGLYFESNSGTYGISDFQRQEDKAFKKSDSELILMYNQYRQFEREDQQ